jgi:uncharacterized membrane protein
MIRNNLFVHRGFTVSFFDALQPIRCHAFAEPADKPIVGGPFRHKCWLQDQQPGAAIRRNQMALTSLFSKTIASLVAASFLAITAPAQDDPAEAEGEALPSHYVLTNLGPVGSIPGQPFHVTDNGLISGSAAYNGNEQATIWYKQWKLDIGTHGLGGSNSVSFGINQWGQAVGEADTSTPDPNGEDFCGFAYMGFTSGKTCRPFLWENGVMTPLPTLKDKNGNSGSNGAANVINSWGKVAGLAENTTMDKTCPAYDPSLGQTQKLQTKPVVWVHGRIHELATVGGDPDGVAFSINETGDVAGASGECAPFNNLNFINIQTVHAILWKHGKPLDLGSLGGATGNIALGINDHDDVIGGSDLAGDTATHGFLWTKETGKMQDLPPFSTDVSSTALAINDNGMIVGVSLDAKFNPRAVAWEHGLAVDLNSRIPHDSRFQLVLACGINAKGEIIGVFVDTKTGLSYGYRASPTE